MIEQSVWVQVDQARAFQVWTDEVTLWWPKGHRLSGDPTGKLILESGADGRFYERTSDGREFDYGRVLAWNPPASLSLAFYLGSSRDSPTVVEVAFTAVNAGTRVDIRHRRGELPVAQFDKTALRFAQGWARMAHAFAHAVAGR